MFTRPMNTPIPPRVWRPDSPGRTLPHPLPTTPQPALAAAEEQLVQEQIFRGVIDATPRNVSIGLVAAFILALAGSHTAGHAPADQPTAWRAWLWFLAVGLVLLHGFGTALRGRRVNDGTALLPHIARQYQRGAYVCAVAWGAGSWVLLPAAAPWASFVVLIGMSMVMLGAGAAMAGCRPTVYVHVALIALVFAAGLMRTLQAQDIAYGLGFVLLGCASLSSAYRQEVALTRAIAGQLRIAALLEQLRGEQALTESARRDAVAAREEAERANAAKTVFMAAASHDLRQPMHALAQYLAAIARQNTDARLAPSIDGASQAMDAMSELLNAVLEISKLMSGAVTPQPDTFMLDEWATRQITQLKPLAGDKGLGLEVFIQPQILVRTDRVLLERIVRNLLHNAITYTRRGRVILHIARRGGHVRIRVADTGAGIPRAHRARVFEPFYQVANPGRNRAHGLGLGLAIVEELAELLHLRLRLTSCIGRGSLFTLTLPLAPDRRQWPRAPSVAQDPTAINHVADAHLVLIDDDDMSLRATEATLQAFGAHVIAGHDADKVLAQLTPGVSCPHLIVSDYRLIEGTGLDAVARIQHHCADLFGPDARPGALIVSGETSPEELARVHAAGAQMLHKPVRPAVLFKHLNAALHRRVGKLPHQASR